MDITLSTPGVNRLAAVLAALRDWQHDTSPLQLHPGDVGWFWRFGAEATAAAVRTWSRSGQMLAVGLLDGPELMRLAVAPKVWRDEELARRLVSDLSGPERGVLPAGRASVEAPNGTRVQDLLSDVGWSDSEPWTPLCRELTGPVEDPKVRVGVIGPERAADYAAVVRSAFGTTRFTDERWHTMSDGPAYAAARSLVAYDDRDVAVAAVTVWSAGPGRPGLIEPLGVHADHRGRGYGRAACLAAAGELRQLGSSSAIVCTPSARTGAVATYRSAGFQPLGERLDLLRPT